MEEEGELGSWCKSSEDLFLQRFPLHRVCRDGDLGELSALLSAGGVDLYEEDCFYGWTPIHWAAYFGKLPCVMKLIEHGASCDSPTERFNTTPAHIAALGGKGHCLKWLLHCGALRNRQDYLGETPIHKAARTGSMECVSLLISQGAKLSIRNHNDSTPSQVAMECGHPQCAEYISRATECQDQSESVYKQSTDTATVLPFMNIEQNVTSENNHPSLPQAVNGISHTDEGDDDMMDTQDVGAGCRLEEFHLSAPVIGMKRGREDIFEEESYKRLRKGDHYGMEESQKLSVIDVSTDNKYKDERCRFLCEFNNNNARPCDVTSTSSLEHDSTVLMQQGYHSLLYLHSLIESDHGN